MDQDREMRGPGRSPSRSPGASRDRSMSPRSPESKRGIRERGRSRSPRADRSGSAIDNNPGNNLFVSGLSVKTRDTDLEQFFNKFGKITKCNIMYDPHSKESRGFAFICYEKVEDAEAARLEMNNFELHGRRITVDKARRTRARTPTPGHYYGPPKRREGGGPYMDGGYPWPPGPPDARYVDRFDPRFDRYDYRGDPRFERSVPRDYRGPPSFPPERGGGGGYYDRPYDRGYPDRYDRDRDRGDRDRDRGDRRSRYGDGAPPREPYGGGGGRPPRY